MFRSTVAVAFALVLVSVFMEANMAKGQVVTEGLVSYWTFDNANITGTTAKDVWGNNDGTIMGVPQIVPGKVREALEFDGLNNYVDCGNDKSLDLAGDITIEVWMKVLKLDLGMHYGIVAKRDACGSFPYQLYLPHNDPVDRPVGFHNKSKLVKSEGLITDNDWHHVAFALGGGAFTFYLDGEASGKGSTEIGPSDPATLKIGWDSCGNNFPEEGKFNGTIDEVRIYSRALSEGEVKQNMASGGLSAVDPADKLALTWGNVKVSK